MKYSDSYISWCPKEIFEESYRQVNALTFGIALEVLKKGYKVARKGWNGKGMYLRLVPNGYFDVGVSIVGKECSGLLPWVGLRTANNKFIPWNASEEDMLAEDWEVISNE